MSLSIRNVIFALLILVCQTVVAGSGLLFNVSATGTPAKVDITLCLNGKAPLSCQNYTVSALTLSILTTVPNHTYPFAGIKINTPGYKIGNLGVGCVLSSNNYCLFSGNSTSPQTITLAVTGPLPISPPVLPSGTINIAYNQTIMAGGGVAPYTYAVSSGSLPSGLSLNSSTGLISGIPNIDNTYNFIITATDANANTGSNPYSLVISGALPLSPSTLPAAIISTPYSQTVTASQGVAPYTYAVTSGSLPIGLSLDGSTGVISGIPTTDNTYNFTITATDVNSNTGSKAYSVVVSGPLPISPSTLPAARLLTSYSQTVTAGGGVAPYTYAVTSGSLPAGLSLNTSTGVISGIPTTDSTYNFTITATDSNADTGSKGYSIVVSGPLPISPSTLPGATISTPYSQTITASGGVAPYTYAVTSGSLPIGLSLNTSTGVISGTPTTDDTYNFTITVTDSNANKGSKAYSIVVSGPLPISPSTLPGATMSTAYSQTVTASNGVPPYTYAVTSGSLPNGLSLNSSTGVISGTPTGVGSSPFTITATDSDSNTGSQGYTILSACGSPAPNLTSGLYSTSTFQLTFTGTNLTSWGTNQITGPAFFTLNTTATNPGDGVTFHVFDGGVWTWTPTTLISDVNSNLSNQVGKYFALCEDDACVCISNFVQIGST